MELNHFNILSKHKSLRNLLINRICLVDKLSYVEVFLNINKEVIQPRSFNYIREFQPYF
jgi:hypothetical protein